MAVAQRISTEIRVRFEECGADGEIRASTFLRYAQDAAWLHSSSAGFGREWYGQRGLAWLVRCLELEVIGSGHIGDAVTVTTEVVGLRRVWARRRGEIIDATGAPVALVLTDWVMTGPGFTLARIPSEIEAFFPATPGTFEPARVPLPPTPADAHRRRFHVRRSELDPMAHVNNAAYVDYMEESLAEAGALEELGLRPRHYRLEYQLAAAPGAAITGATWRDGESWAYRLSDEAGADLLRARFWTTGQRPKVRP
ncbi:MAG: acyl-[acyl-carrier-protein] thioesterase [Candidatus Limnocylindrales bacterium]